MLYIFILMLHRGLFASPLISENSTSSLFFFHHMREAELQSFQSLERWNKCSYNVDAV